MLTCLNYIPPTKWQREKVQIPLMPTVRGAVICDFATRFTSSPYLRQGSTEEGAQEGMFSTNP
jgi:hypothetical protein